MAFWISRKVFLRYSTCGNSSSNACLFLVRRNASSIRPEPRPLLPDRSSTTSLESSQQKAVRRIKAAKAATVSALLREYGFTDAHISRLESRFSSIFALSPQKNLSLKLKFLETIGLSSTDIPKFVQRNPYFLSASLEKKLIPCYNYLKKFSICGGQLNQMLKSCPESLTANWETTVAPNVELLRSMGVPISVITCCVSHHNFVISCSHALFKSCVDQAIELGLNPSTKAFILAVCVLSRISKQTWGRKMEVYRGFGFSDDEILSAFRKQPKIMSISEEKMARGLEFLFKELSWGPAAITSNPAVLRYSLEKRVIPRCKVVEILRKKGLLKISISPHLLTISEEKFVNKYIHSHKDVSSELMDIYKRYTSSQSKTL